LRFETDWLLAASGSDVTFAEDGEGDLFELGHSGAPLKTARSMIASLTRGRVSMFKAPILAAARPAAWANVVAV